MITKIFQGYKNFIIKLLLIIANKNKNMIISSKIDDILKNREKHEERIFFNLISPVAFVLCFWCYFLL